MMKSTVNPHPKFSLRIFTLMLLLAVFGTGLALLPLSQPTSAQTTTTLGSALKTLTFRLQIDGGVDPIVSVVVDEDSFCLSPNGVVLSKYETVQIEFQSHEYLDNLVCRHDIYFDFVNFENCTVSVVKTGSTADLSFASTSTRGERILRIEGQGTPNFRSGNGALKAVDSSNADISGGADLSSVSVVVNSCTTNTGPSGNRFYVNNPEPDQAMEGVFTTVQNCLPEGGNRIEIDVRSQGREFVELSTDCVWEFSFFDPRDGCTAVAAIYREGETVPRRIVGSRNVDQTVTLRTVFARRGQGRGEVLYEGIRVTHIYIYRSQSCVQVVLATININVPPGLEEEPVSVRIYPSSTSRTRDCTTTNVTVTGNTPATVWLRRRGRLSTTRCVYVFAPQEVAGPLQLDTSELPVQSFNIVNGRYSTLIDYSSTQIPIQLHSVFPSDRVFTTLDRVAFRLYSTGDCARVTNSLGGVLSAGVGVHREFQAYPSTTQLLGLNATRVGGSPPYIYSMPPSIVATNVFGASRVAYCSVSVTVAKTPSRCEVAGDQTQTVVADDDSESFDFFVVFSCDGVTGVKVEPNEPPTPLSPGEVAPSTSKNPRTVRLGMGWQMFSYNGANDTEPEDFLEDISSSVRSIWKWDTTNQRWLGYEPGRTSTLDEIDTGDVIFMYVPRTTSVVLTPGDLLSAVGTDFSVVLEPKYNLIAYKGPTQSVEEAFDESEILAVHRWDNANQDWDIYIPDESSSADLYQIEAGDLLFVYAFTTNDVRINY